MAAVWAITAWLTADANYVLFPPLIALLMPVGYRLDGGPPLSWPAAAGAGVSGLLNVSIVAGVLLATGRLDGRPALPGFSLLAEDVLSGSVGALVGAAIAHWLPKR